MDGYHVTLQAGEVVELVNFDSGQSSLSILQSPCSNKSFTSSVWGGFIEEEQEDSTQIDDAEEKPEFPPVETELITNFPNPFSDKTMIEYVIGEQGPVSVTVFDCQMKPVAQLVKENQNPGKYSIPFNGSHLPPGIYFCKLITDNYSGVISLAHIK